MVPNPACCFTSKVEHLCPDCKTAYYKLNPHLSNTATVSREDILPLPKIDWAEERHSTARAPIVVNESYFNDGRLLIAPVINWAEQRRSERERKHDCRCAK